MKTECQGRREFLRQTLAFIGGLLVAQSMGPQVWAAYRPALVKSDRANAPPMQIVSESRSSRFNEGEEILLAMLVDIIFPNDGHGPSAEDIDLVHALSVFVSGSPQRFLTYREGLSRVETLSETLYASRFSTLPLEHRYDLLAYLDKVKTNMDREVFTLKDKIVRKWRYVYYTWRGILQTADFWVTLRSDSLVLYYSHELTWKWLGYNGPPFPNGYVAEFSA